MNTLSRAAFFTLDPIAQASHIRSGGTVIDDPPVVDRYADLTSIVDGKQRWAAYDARKKALGADAVKAPVVAQDTPAPADGTMTRADAYRHLRTGGGRDGVPAEHLADWDRTVRTVG